MFLLITKRSVGSAFTLAFFGVLLSTGLAAQSSYAPGQRTVNDAHNCYPYDGRWNDRIDRSLSTGLPIAIEQDLNWYVPADGSTPQVLVSHGGKLSGAEPTFERYFFKRIAPLVEAALKNPDRTQWPIITLNLDFKTEETSELRAVWAILMAHRVWLTTAERVADGSVAQPLTVGPVLVLNGPSDQQQRIFYDDVAIGDRLLTFGAVHTNMTDLSAEPSAIETERVSNYRRWWNNPWKVVESIGQSKAGQWNAFSSERLQSLVQYAHRQGLWIRFYTLDGATPEQQKTNGWYAQYNFASMAAAQQRWSAAIDAGVDYLASDQYEQVGALIHGHAETPEPVIEHSQQL
jgi:hypothetical protein